MTFANTHTIEKLQPGRVLDGYVHDVLGFPEPVWPYSNLRQISI
jgi:hypothetical protein